MAEEPATRRIQATYDRVALWYDIQEWLPERLAFRRWRRLLWERVPDGKVLEVGVGTGKNLPHYPAGARVVAVDFSPRMLRRAVRRARRLGREVDLILADAQALPFRNGVFNAAAATFVFCSVPDPVVGFEEVRRVLGDGGQVHLLEHVRARNPLLGRLMDLANPLWVRLAGANINRDTESNVAKAGISLHAVESRGLGIVKLMRGSAGRPGVQRGLRAAEAANSGEAARQMP